MADLDEAETALASEDWRWFAVRLPAGERSRLYPCLAGETWFLDIETTGLSPFKSEITTVALYDGARCRVLVHGRDIEETPVLLDQKTLLVTFNGKAFDLRFLRHRLGWKGGDLHLDLWHEFRARGMSGGLKKIERRLGMAKRTSAVQNGMEAIKLWYQYLAGDGQALRRLVAYNEEDARVLKSLVLYLIEQSMVAYPMGESLVRRAIARNTPRT
ncbi:MAG: ribonuclease H-like domain-containing protein [Candidatus Eisenbacteria sp.]|nr:ribonuclease H-like domain-containing protein [Candidatus Eisenbacteria bacterium]